ncbi:LuxR C-terminal-related transcriptional regulator [Kitasatospora sp. LaBMicrA B282]|uniref:LuxR C-terminal-related transcriptional regulator n=1 Tax=Kitasatospora sp. LaBMicrA B282 TaxID=3420949 RepID=UPI003D14B33F
MQGIDSAAEAVYRLLLTDHQLDVAQISARLRLDPTEVMVALAQLTDARLLRPSDGVPGEAPGGLHPVDPRVGLPALLQHNEAMRQRSQQEFEESQAAISRLLAEYRDESATEDNTQIERLVGMATVQTRLEELTRSTAGECLAFSPGGTQSASSLEASRPLNSELLGRGVSMRSVYLDSVRKDRATTRHAEWLTELGGEVRTVPALPLRMIILDRRVALVPIDPNDTRKGAVQLSTKGVITALVSLFEQVWENAIPFGAPKERDEQGLTRQEQELLRLLGQGCTDEAAGKQLGLSVRTVRRIMADLMERLGARSRFEAGLHAGRRGWL